MVRKSPCLASEMRFPSKSNVYIASGHQVSRIFERLMRRLWSFSGPGPSAQNGSFGGRLNAMRICSSELKGAHLPVLLP